MKLLIVTFVAWTVKPADAVRVAPPAVAVATTSSAPAPVLLAGERMTTAVPSVRVSAVATLVTASARATENDTTWPARALPLASFSVAVSVPGLAELIELLLSDRVSVGLPVVPPLPLPSPVPPPLPKPLLPESPPPPPQATSVDTASIERMRLRIIMVGIPATFSSTAFSAPPSGRSRSWV